MFPKLFAAAALAGVLLGGAAQAETVTYMASLNGGSEVPANTEKGTGDVLATLDTATKVLSYTVTYKDLTGPATAAHFHGPAAPGANAPPMVVVPSATVATSPIKGTATLTDAQIQAMNGGQMYFNLHTAAHPPGEIRGQIMKH